MQPKVISKVLTPNDTGETGGHQDGICVPRDPEILSFFPTLDVKTKNPRAILSIFDGDKEWDFAFIYYNGRFFGGTRNEYRLTGMARYFRDMGLTSGDTVVLTRNEDGHYSISYIKNENATNGIIVITSTKWKSIKMQGGTLR